MIPEPFIVADFCIDLTVTDNLVHVYPVLTHQSLPA